MKRPRRVQRKRLKGYRLPPGTVCVTHETPWGNPHDWEVLGRAEAKRRFEIDMAGDPVYRRRARAVLRGKNLACYCPLDQPCHADVLLRIANEFPDDGKPFGTEQ